MLYGIQAFVPHMIGHGEPGHIVNTGSVAAVLPAGRPYGVGKHAVLSLTETLEQGLRQLDSALRSSLLCPGLVNTRITHSERNRPEELKAEEVPDPERVKMVRATLSGGTPPSEIAERVLESIESETSTSCQTRSGIIWCASAPKPSSPAAKSRASLGNRPLSPRSLSVRDTPSDPIGQITRSIFASRHLFMGGGAYIPNTFRWYAADLPVICWK